MVLDYVFLAVFPMGIGGAAVTIIMYRGAELYAHFRMYPRSGLLRQRGAAAAHAVLSVKKDN